MAVLSYQKLQQSIYSCRIKTATTVSDCITSYDARTPFAVKFRRLYARLTVRFNEMQLPISSWQTGTHSTHNVIKLFEKKS